MLFTKNCHAHAYKFLFTFSIRMLEARSLSYVDGPVPIPADNSFLLQNVKRIQICDTGMAIHLNWEVFLLVLYYSWHPYSEC